MRYILPSTKLEKCEGVFRYFMNTHPRNVIFPAYFLESTNVILKKKIIIKHDHFKLNKVSDKTIDKT